MLNGVSNVFGKLGSYIYIYSSLVLLFISSIIISNLLVDSAYADNITTNVTINPSLTLTIPTSTISLDLDPASTTFASQNLVVSVGTNNKAGYNLTMSSTTTDLVNTEDNAKTIPTLTSSTTLSDFPVNKWGYKKDQGNYLPFETNTTLLSSDSPVNNDTTTLNFASKIDYKQPAGTYNISLDFKALPNVTTNYIQNLDPTLCTEDPMVVVDSRDEQTYIVQRLKDGKCWMMTNLNLGATPLSVAQLDSTNTNFAGTISATEFNGWNYGDTFGAATFTSPQYIPVTAANSGTGSDTDPNTNTKYGTLYNYCVTSAKTICTDSNSSNATSDICPAGWRLPTGGASSSNNEFYTLYNYYNSYDKIRAPIADDGVAIPLAGAYYNSSINPTLQVGSQSVYWSSIRNDPTRMYNFHVNGSTRVVTPTTYDHRSWKLSVRCVLK